MNIAEKPDIFEKRYYELVRMQSLAPAIGRTALGAEQLAGIERRRYNELTSGIAEALPGIVKTEWTYETKDGKLIAEDGQELEQLLINGLHHSLHMADSDEFYAQFLPPRAQHELDELREQEAMVKGEAGYNTIVTFSPYTEEYSSPQSLQKLKKAAQEPEWQRGMIRVSHTQDGKLYIFTRSVDKSDTKLFREIGRRQFNYEFASKNSTEMLGERLHLNFNDDSWRNLADTLTAQADTILSERWGGEWIQGRPTGDALDTQKHVESQGEIVQALLRASEKLALQYGDFENYKTAFEREAYNHIALLKLRRETVNDSPIVNIGTASIAAGVIAGSRGDVYNMCGYVLTPDGTTTQTSVNTGFESLLRLAGKEVKCPACKENVVMPTGKLLEGRLCCGECKYEVDACTGVIYRKSQIINSTPKGAMAQKLPTKETDWQKIVREDIERKAAQKKRRSREQLAKKAA